MISNKEISWVGICTRNSLKQERSFHSKTLDVPFKLKEERTRYILRISNVKSESNQQIIYEIHEIVNDTDNELETLLRSKTENYPTPLMKSILEGKRPKRHYRWIKGWLRNP